MATDEEMEGLGGSSARRDRVKRLVSDSEDGQEMESQEVKRSRTSLTEGREEHGMEMGDMDLDGEEERRMDEDGDVKVSDAFVDSRGLLHFVAGRRLGEDGEADARALEEGGPRGQFSVFPGPIEPFLGPSDANEQAEEEGEESSEEEDDVDGRYGDDDDDATQRETFVLDRAPIRRRSVSEGMVFGDLGRPVEPERSSRASSEASTIRLYDRRRFTARSNAPSPPTGIPALTPATAQLPNSARPSSLRGWRYKDVVLPDPLPKSIGQWAKLEQKVRMITPLPNARNPERIYQGTLREARASFEELMAKDQKRVVEVVRKSYDEELDGQKKFWTGIDKKGMQIAWDHVSDQCVRNIKAILQHIEYEDFDQELEEISTWTAEDEEFDAVKRDDNFWGVGWELRGSSGKFEGLDEESMKYWHEQVWSRAERTSVTSDGEDSSPPKDGEESSRTKSHKKKTARKAKLAQSKRTRLVGGEPGPWKFWTEADNRHLQTWVLSAQQNAFGAT